MVAVSSSEIRSSVWSDHVPVFLELAISNGATSKWSWRLNDNLLEYEVCMTEIRQTIDSFVLDHAKDATSLPVQWETLKCVLRGFFLKHGSRLKKERS